MPLQKGLTGTSRTSADYVTAPYFLNCAAMGSSERLKFHIGCNVPQRFLGNQLPTHPQLWVFLKSELGSWLGLSVCECGCRLQLTGSGQSKKKHTFMPFPLFVLYCTQVLVCSAHTQITCTFRVIENLLEFQLRTSGPSPTCDRIGIELGLENLLF